MEYIVKFNGYLNKILAFFSGTAVLILTCIAAGNMFLRIVYNPINGSYELIGFFWCRCNRFCPWLYPDKERSYNSNNIYR